MSKIARAAAASLILLVLFSMCALRAQERTDYVDALPPWPRLLDAPLETIALGVHAVGDLPPGFRVDDVEAECFKYLRNSLASTPDINVVRLTDIMLQGMLQRQPISERGTIAVQYLITVKEWNHAGLSAPVLIGAVELDIKQPWRPARASPAMRFPLGLFLVTPGDASLHQAVMGALGSHMDRHVVAPVKASRLK